MIETLHPFVDRYAFNQHPRDAGPPSPFATERLNPIQVPSHHRQRPVKRSHGSSQLFSWPTRVTRPRCHIFIAIAIVVSCCCSLAIAEATPVIPDEITNPLHNAPPELHAKLDELAVSGTILFDPNPPPVPANNYWEFEIDTVIQEGLWRRENARGLSGTPSNTSTVASTTGSSTPLTASTPTRSSSASTMASSSVSSSAPASSGTSAVPSPIPSPFDSSLGANFTAATCPDYITSFLNNATFKSCLPFSLLLEVRSSSLLHLPSPS
jgi:hypothetical protein